MTKYPFYQFTFKSVAMMLLKYYIIQRYTMSVLTLVLMSLRKLGIRISTNNKENHPGLNDMCGIYNLLYTKK